MPRSGDPSRQEWVSTLESAGCSEAYPAKHEELNTRDMINFLLFDLDNSVERAYLPGDGAAQCAGAENGLTREMWESLNSSWLEFQTIKPEFLRSDALPRILDWIKERSAAYRGALLNTILRNDTYYFSQLGTFLERADNTARILDVKYYVLLPSSNMVGGGVDNVQWEAILRSVSAHRSYRWVYKDSYRSWHIADYLILNRAMPRSLRACYEEIDALLEQLSTLYGDQKPCLETSKSTLALLEHGDIDTIFQAGLHEFLLDFIARNNRVGHEISEAYSFNS